MLCFVSMVSGRCLSYRNPSSHLYTSTHTHAHSHARTSRTWISDTVMIITILDVTGVSDPIDTRVGTLFFYIESAGGLKMEHNYTEATQLDTPFYLNGTWVRGLCLCPPRHTHTLARTPFA